MGEEKLDQILLLVKEIGGKVEKLSTEVKEIKTRVENIEIRVGGIETEIKELRKENERQHQQTRKEFENLKLSLIYIIQGFEEYIDNKFDELEKRMEANERKYHAVETINYMEHESFKKDIKRIKVKNNIKEMDNEDLMKQLL